MTAQSSASKSGVFYKFLPYYLNKVKYLRPQLIMSIIFSVLSYPVVMLLIDITCPLEREYYRLMELYGGIINDSSPEQYALYQAAEDKVNLMYSLLVAAVVIGIISLVGLFIFTFVTTLRSFRYLNNKSIVDMDLSLPVNHNTRFFGDLAAVFTVNILPHLGAITLAQILLQFSDMQAFDNNGQAKMTVEAIMGPMAFTGLFMCIMEAAITLLMISVCGRLAEACIYPILINFAIPVIHSMTLNLVESGVYGAVLNHSAVSSFGSVYPITASSPFGMLTMTLYSMILTSCDGKIGDIAPIFRPEYGIPALLVTLACFAGAYFLIKYRRAERVGMPYVFKGMSLVIPGIVIFAITVPVSYLISINVRGQERAVDYYSYTQNTVPGLVIGTVIGTFILYIIMELISGRNFRRFGISLLKWAGTLAACAMICFGLNMANGFGAAYYVPQPENVLSVGVSYENINIPSAEYRSSALMKNNYRITAYSNDSELLQLVKELHEEVPKNNSGWADEGFIVNFCYTMKDGTLLERCYSVSSELFEDFRRKLVTPECWYNSVCGDMLNEEAAGHHIGNVWVMSSVGAGSSGLYEAIKQDSTKINLDFIEDEASWKYTDVFVDFRIDNSGRTTAVSFKVYNWMDNTIDYLESIGLDIRSKFDGSGYNTAFILKNAWGYDYAQLFGQSEGYSLDEYLQIADLYSDKGYDGLYYNTEFTYGRISSSDPDFRKLLSVCSSGDFYGDSDAYTVLLFKSKDLNEYVSSGEWEPVIFAVPPEYNSLAEDILERCLIQEFIGNTAPEDGDLIIPDSADREAI